MGSNDRLQDTNVITQHFNIEKQLNQKESVPKLVCAWFFIYHINAFFIKAFRSPFDFYFVIDISVLIAICSRTYVIQKLFDYYIVSPDSDWPQLRGLAILALRGTLKFFAVLNILGEDFMIFWREHDELFNRFPEEFKNSKSFPSGPFYFRFVLPGSLF